MSRSRFLLCSVLAGGLAVPGCSGPRPRPNVVLVTLDTTRADRIGCYGYAPARTPNVDRLAAEGVRATNAVAAAPITLPSHATMMTGLHPPAHGIRDNGAFLLGDDATTLAERLKASGYATQAFVSAVVLDRRYRLDQGFDGYDDDLLAEDAPSLFMVRDRPAARTAERFLEWFASWRAGPSRKPFFAWVHFFDPHQPWRPLAADLALAASPYDAEITGADRAVGRLVEALRQAGVLDDTLVVLTADHGESLGEHGERTHAIFVYDATVRVPLVLRYPRVLPAGRVYDGAVRHVDLVPTILSVLGLPGGRETQGEDLLSALRGERRAPDLPQYSESLLSELGFGMAPLHALRWDGYKWIRAPRPELYDLRADPGELRNLYEQDERRAGLLDRELQRVLDESGRRATQARENPLTGETEEMLQSLGYLAAGSERRAVAGLDPKDGIVIYTRLEDARHLAQQARWVEAEQVLRGILADVRRHVSARNILGLCLTRRKRYREAEHEYLQSLAVDPGQFRVRGALGSVALLRGDLDAAASHFQAALSAAPTFVEAMANLGFIRALHDDEAGARAWYEKAVAADPNLSLAHRRLGDLHYEAGRHADALRFYERALEVAPSDFRAAIQAGNCAKRVGDARRAEAHYRRAGELRRDSWIPPYNLACLWATTGRTDEALAALDQARANGLAEPRRLESDVDLASLRGLPRFRGLLASMQHAGTR